MDCLNLVLAGRFFEAAAAAFAARDENLRFIQLHHMQCEGPGRTTIRDFLLPLSPRFEPTNGLMRSFQPDFRFSRRSEMFGSKVSRYC